MKFWTTTDAILGCLIRQTRLKAGLTQPEMAQRTGMTQSNLSRVENGQPITAGQLLRVCAPLPWAASMFLGEVQEYRRLLRRRVRIVDHGELIPAGAIKLAGKALIPWVQVK